MGWKNKTPWPAGAIFVNLTTYCPYQSGLSPEQQRIEGGKTDPKGNRLITLEEHIADPVANPYCSCSGDKTLWAYGQRVLLPSLGTPSAEWQQASGETDYVFRVVDTGGNFTGAGKVYRHPTAGNPSGPGLVGGWEPLDICVGECYGANASSKVLALGVGQQQGTVVDDTDVPATPTSIASDALAAVGLPDVDPSAALPLVGLGIAGLFVATWLLLSSGVKGIV